MSEIVTNLISNLDFTSKKAHSHSAWKLHDGDLTNQEVGPLIVRELDDIKYKLDGLNRKDLLLSINFLEEGVACMGKVFQSGDSSTSDLLKNEKPLKDTTFAEKGALARAIEKLNIDDPLSLAIAVKNFHEAANFASMAFFNVALNVEERILASKLRIASGILEHLDDPELALVDCLHYLQELHDFTAIQEMFSVHLRGGLKAFFKKARRIELVNTVIMINFILADFILRFTGRRMGIFDWPVINCGKEVVHPIYCKKDRVPNLKELEIPMLLWVWLKEMPTSASCTINSKGDIICASLDENQTYVLCKLDRATGIWQLFSLPSGSDKICKGGSLATDDNDMVYVLSYKDDLGSDTITLSVYSPDGEIVEQASLVINEKEVAYYIAVMKDEKLVICSEHGDVFLYDSSGGEIERIGSFSISPEVEDFARVSSVHVSSDASVSGDKSAENEIVIIYSSSDPSLAHVCVYTQQGKLKTVYKLSCPLPFLQQEHSISVTFDPARKNCIFCCGIYGETTIIVEFVSINGKQRVVHFLEADNIIGHGKHLGRLVSHASGAIAMVNQDRVIYLKLSGRNVVES